MRALDLTEAVDWLLEGKVVALPTDTIYGLAAISADLLIARKGRDPSRPFALALPDSVDPREWIECEEHYLAWLTQGVTLVGWKRDQKVGIRVPNHPLTQAVLRQTGPLWLTSVNRSGEAPAIYLEEIQEGLADGVLAGVCVLGQPSTVIDLHGGPKILRQGAFHPPLEVVRAVVVE